MISPYISVIIFFLRLYILRGFGKLVIAFFTVKNTPNLINLFLFLKKRNKVKIVNQLKFSHYLHPFHFPVPASLPQVSNQK